MSESKADTPESEPEAGEAQGSEPQSGEARGGEAQAESIGTAPAPAGEGDRIALLEAEISQLKDQLLRALAETENVRRRGRTCWRSPTTCAGRSTACPGRRRRTIAS
jgi:molecular chaperone GrpE